jgi:hypothetical protein
VRFRLPDGILLRSKKLEIADKLDLARLEFEEPPAKIAPLNICTNYPSINEPIKTYGNSLGDGAITELKGKILAVGPDLVEVDAKFVKGNSGSPIINKKGLVVGVATEAKRRPENWITAGTRFAETRRFGVRLSNGIRWVEVEPQSYYNQTKLLNDSFEYWKNATFLANFWQNKKSYKKGKDKITAYANKKRRPDLPKTPWDKAIVDYSKSYLNYWEVKGTKISANSMTFQQAETRLKRAFLKMPTAPLNRLKLMDWSSEYLMKRARKEAAYCILLKTQVESYVKEDSKFWETDIMN